MSEQMKYSEIRPILATGDLILFSGRSAISTAIKIASRSKYSHAGMVIREGQYVLCWESTTLTDVTDHEDGIVKSGVQVVNFSKHIAGYNGKIAIRHVLKPLTTQALLILADTRHELKDVPYEKDMLELLLSIYDGPFGENTPDLSSIFCLELIAEYHKRIGRLKGRKPANEYSLRDFERQLNGIYGPIIEIDRGI